MLVRIILILIVTGVVNVVAAQSPAAIDNIERELLPHQYLHGNVTKHSIAEAMLKDNIPGLSMTFIDNGKIAWQRSYGYANLGALSAINAKTVFAGASLSKPLAAITAMQFVESGQISLDGDINRYLTSWKLPDSKFTEQRKVTLRQLIAHRAGVSNDVPSPYGVDDKLPTVSQMLQGKAPSTGPALTLFATPGEQYQYANPGYMVIQQLIEDVSGLSFDDAVSAAIFDKINMDSSSFRQPMPAALMARRASGYNEKLQAYPYQLFPFKGAGGVWTTPTDLARFVMALINDYHQGEDVLISRAIAEQIFAPEPIRLGFKKHFVDGSDDIVFDHWGSIPGFTSYLVGSLQHRQALVMMTNSDNGFSLMAAIARTVAQHHDWRPIKPIVYQRHALTSSQLNKFTGTFGKTSAKETQHIYAVNNGQLHLTSGLQDAARQLIAVGNATFIDPESNSTFEFLANKAGEFSWVRVTLQSGYNYDQPKQQD